MTRTELAALILAAFGADERPDVVSTLSLELQPGRVCLSVISHPGNNANVKRSTTYTKLVAP